MVATAQTRVTGGEWRGRVISTPREQVFRPTRAIVREALFNIIGDGVVGAGVVDLFAGAGTVGFESLSRGAREAVFVDHDERALSHVRITAQRLGCASRVRVVRSDALRWTRSHTAELATADLVFVDAPYRDDVVMAVLAVLGDAPPRTVVCEHHRARALPERVGRLAVVRRGHYGITDLTVLRPAGVEEVSGE
jgi:16S rRNA (guanine966-N2)-methyltransferase